MFEGGQSLLPFLHCSLDFLNLHNIPGFEIGGYLDSLLQSTSPLYFGLIFLSFLIFVLGQWRAESTRKGDVNFTQVDQNPLQQLRMSGSTKPKDDKECLFSRVKKARNKAIRETLEKDMTPEEKMREKDATKDMLNRVYNLMQENEEMFGSTSIEELQSQMELYKD